MPCVNEDNQFFDSDRYPDGFRREEQRRLHHRRRYWMTLAPGATDWRLADRRIADRRIADGETFSCERCSGEFPVDIADDDHSPWNGAIHWVLCPNCADGLIRCDDCGEYAFCAHDNHSDLCQSCGESREYDEDQRSEYVCDYHGSSKHWTRYRLPSESPKAETYGIEWETSAEGNADEICEDYLSALIRSDMVRIEEDGSVARDSMELIYQPMTYRYAMSHFDRLFGPVIKAYSAGLRSHPKYGCGMHVSIGIEAWSSVSIYRLITLLYGYPNLTAYLSRRKSESALLQWAPPSLAGMTLFNDARKRWAIHKTQSNHYSAVTIDHRRIELRIFRGTLRETLFRYNLECAKAIFDFCQSSPGMHCTAAEFRTWIKKWRKVYPLVAAHLARVEEGSDPQVRIDQFTQGMVTARDIAAVIEHAQYSA